MFEKTPLSKSLGNGTNCTANEGVVTNCVVPKSRKCHGSLTNTSRVASMVQRSFGIGPVPTRCSWIIVKYQRVLVEFRYPKSFPQDSLMSPLGKSGKPLQYGSCDVPSIQCIVCHTRKTVFTSLFFVLTCFDPFPCYMS